MALVGHGDALARGWGVGTPDKVVKIGGRKAFQYTALDDCARFRVLRLYRRQNQWSSPDFLGEVSEPCPSLFGNFSPTTALTRAKRRLRSLRCAYQSPSWLELGCRLQHRA
jgi:hypothetical protein